MVASDIIRECVLCVYICVWTQTYTRQHLEVPKIWVLFCKETLMIKPACRHCWWSQDRRIVQGGIALASHEGSLLFKTGSATKSDQVVCVWVQLPHGNLSLHNLPGQPSPMLDCPHGGKAFSYIQSEPFFFQLVYVVSYFSSTTKDLPFS